MCVSFFLIRKKPNQMVRLQISVKILLASQIFFMLGVSLLTLMLLMSAGERTVLTMMLAQIQSRSRSSS